jgi:hypothetical protein
MTGTGLNDKGNVTNDKALGWLTKGKFPIERPMPL